ncbi:MAG: hypothetical protein M1822_006595 [Bathelium mastoideum]|nr:MAG: hypothetical protein M1822_006595 [Bathelium mastoideum]
MRKKRRLPQERLMNLEEAEEMSVVGVGRWASASSSAARLGEAMVLSTSQQQSGVRAEWRWSAVQRKEEGASETTGARSSRSTGARTFPPRLGPAAPGRGGKEQAR